MRHIKTMNHAHTHTHTQMIEHQLLVSSHVQVSNMLDVYDT